MEACDSEIGEPHGPTESGVNPSSGRLVYVRRRVEVVDTAKATKEATSSPQGLTSTSTSISSSSRHRLEWEERYHHLQMLLNKLNDSDETDHVQMLWSLSSAELSKHAVDLEKRSIQFSLDEAREMQRVAALNVLGRSATSFKSTSNDA